MNRISLCDARTGASSHSLLGHKGGCKVVQWSPRNEYLLASGGEDHTIRLWDVRKSGVFHSFDRNLHKIRQKSKYAHLIHENDTPVAHLASVVGLSFTPNGLYLVSLSQNMEVHLWDMEDFTNTLVHYHTLSYKYCSVNQITINSDDSVVAFALGNGIGLYDLYSGHPISRMTESYGERVTDVKFHPELEELYSADTNGRITVHTPSINHINPVQAVEQN